MKILKQYLDKYCNIIFIKMEYKGKTIYVIPKVMIKSINRSSFSFTINEKLIRKIIDANRGLDYNFEKYYLAPSFLQDKDYLDIYTKNKIFADILIKSIYYLKYIKSKYTMVIDRDKFKILYDKILSTYIHKNEVGLKNILTNDILYVLDEEMKNRITYLQENNEINRYDIKFKYDINIYDKFITNKPSNIYYTELQNIDQYYFLLKNKVYYVKMTTKINEVNTLEDIYNNNGGHHKNFNFNFLYSLF